MKTYGNKLLILVVLGIFFSGCTQPKKANQASESTQTGTISQTTLTQVKEATHPIAVINRNTIQLVSSEYEQPLNVYTLSGDEIPPAFELFDIKISPTQEYLVWYTPVKGVLALKIGDNTTKVLRGPNQWLDNNPYFEFDNTDDILYIVDDEGNGFYRIDIQNQETTKIDIPFPFGNDYKLSPDMKKIIFISGFGQSNGNPEYMFTTIEGADPVRFRTETPLNLRQRIAWLPDSSGAIIIGENSQLLLVKYGSEASQVYYTDPNQGQINDLYIRDNLIYYERDNRWWHVLDANTKEEVARIPKEIAQEVHRPLFIPWYDNSFLIEETLRLDPEQFKRLWHSNFIGIKELLVEKYDETTITSDLPSI